MLFSITFDIFPPYKHHCMIKWRKPGIKMACALYYTFETYKKSMLIGSPDV